MDLYVYWGRRDCLHVLHCLSFVPKGRLFNNLYLGLTAQLCVLVGQVIECPQDWSGLMHRKVFCMVKCLLTPPKGT